MEPSGALATAGVVAVLLVEVLLVAAAVGWTDPAEHGGFVVAAQERQQWPGPS